ncbi:hypothetical protein L4D00_15075 [Photobacterium swingsii]|uniref:hypothetical protein n=1 Tax=Photobacterium swingsii TaxID=680026 RepID=UPI003D0F1500
MRQHHNPFGKGITDMPTKIDGKVTKVYTLWFSLLQRCYDPAWKANNKAYDGASLHEEWHTLSVFNQWFEQNYIKGWELDKDLFGKHYSPSSCSFVPKIVNMFTTKSGRKQTNGLMAGVYRPTGVKSGRFAAQCKDPILDKNVYLGMHDTELQAHQKHVERKHQIALQLVDLYPEMTTEAKQALSTRYLQ